LRKKEIKFKKTIPTTKSYLILNNLINKKYKEIIKDNIKRNKDDVRPTSSLILSCQTTVYNSCKYLNGNFKSIKIETMNET